MKPFRIIAPIVVTTSCWCATASMGQVVRWPELHPYQAAVFEAAAVRIDVQHRAAIGELELYARTQTLSLTTSEHGRWYAEGAERVCRIRVRSQGALAMELLLEHVLVPPGATLLLRGDDGRELAPMVSLDLPSSIHETSSPMVFADDIVLEYREPFDAAFEGRFSIQGVAHAYRYVDGIQREGTCHVNVACEPESIGWEDVIKATVRISVVTPEGNGWCTGTLVNNVRQDCAPFILSAFHCGRTSTAAQFNQYKFYFNFQYATCTGGAYSTAQFLTGAERVAYSNDYAPNLGGLGGSDFMLLRTTAAIPDQFQPYWAGWDATNISAVTADGVCIHHPTGAPKRISSYTQTLTTGHPMASSGLMSHYKAKWAATSNGHGVTEFGSSGAGLFKPNTANGPLLIGTLTGSSAGMTCVNNTGTAYFGKMSYHWTNNPNTAAIKLKPWLDPDATGTLVLAGSPAPCAAAAHVATQATTSHLRVFPNPSTGVIGVELPAALVRGAELRLIDLAGRVVLQRSIPTTAEFITIDAAHLPDGPYTLSALGTNLHLTAPISLQH